MYICIMHQILCIPCANVYWHCQCSMWHIILYNLQAEASMMHVKPIVQFISDTSSPLCGSRVWISPSTTNSRLYRSSNSSTKMCEAYGDIITHGLHTNTSNYIWFTNLREQVQIDTRMLQRAHMHVIYNILSVYIYIYICMY